MAKNNEIQMLYGFITVRVVLLYLSTTISSNIMSQIYTERVLINGEEPPVLRNQIFLFAVVDIMLNLLFCGVIAFIDKISDSNDYPLTIKYISQYGISLAVLLVLSLLISNTMYNKKYFLYKDDGLRAVRALNEMILRIGALTSLTPFFLVLKNDNIATKLNAVA